MQLRTRGTSTSRRQRGSKVSGRNRGRISKGMPGNGNSSEAVLGMKRWDSELGDFVQGWSSKWSS